MGPIIEIAGPQTSQTLNGVPVITDTELYGHLFGDNLPMSQAVVIQKGQRWMVANNATHCMIGDNRAIAAANAKLTGKSTLVILRNDSPFILQKPTTGKV